MKNAEKYAQELAQDTDKMAEMMMGLACNDCPASEYCTKRMEEVLAKCDYLCCYEIVKEWLEMEVDSNGV